MVTNQIKRLQQKGMFGRGLLKEHFCKILSKYLQWDFFPHGKSMATISCHSDQSSYPIGTKNNSIRSPSL